MAILGGMKTALEKYAPAAFSRLKQFTEINSYTLHREGVLQAGAFYAAIFAPLGFQADWAEPADPRWGRHLFLTRRGSGERQILFIGHLDTVFSREEQQRENFFWREEGSKVYGPGVMDMKGGDIMIWLMLQALREAEPALFEQTTWHIHMNAAEEVLAADFSSHSLARLQADRVDAALVMEFGPVDGSNCKIISQRKGRADLRIAVRGKGAHSGNHHTGASAIAQLAEVILAVEKLTDYEAEVTVNVGLVRGGEMCSKIPHYAEADVEIRALSEASLSATIAKIMSFNGYSTIASRDGKFRARVEVELIRQVPPCPASAGALRLLSLWQEAGRELGFRVDAYIRGGLSDANYFGRHIPTLDGLGPSGANAHTSQNLPEQGIEPEWMDRSSFATKAHLNISAILNLLT